MDRGHRSHFLFLMISAPNRLDNNNLKGFLPLDNQYLSAMDTSKYEVDDGLWSVVKKELHADNLGRFGTNPLAQCQAKLSLGCGLR
jgi:hypothetical protein